MNEDMQNLFSTRGAYVDDDGIEIGSNDVLGSRPSSPRFLFKMMTGYTPPRPSEALRKAKELDAKTERVFWYGVRATLLLGGIALVWRLWVLQH